MNFHVLTLFPEMIENGMATSITGRAIEKGAISIEAINIRNFAFNKHQSVDDYPYGGGAGMLMQAEPVYLAWEAAVAGIRERRSHTATGEVHSGAGEIIGEMSPGIVIKEKNQVIAGEMPPCTIYLTPQGKTFSQEQAREFAQSEDLILLCGHYEGIDERVVEEIVTDYVSIGDYVLTGGEFAAMVVMDAVSRMVPGVLGNDESAGTESFSAGLLEYPQYSRPQVWHGREVPEVLMSGHHANVDAWRREQSIIRTVQRRPDLLKTADLSNKEWNFVRQLKKQIKEEKNE